MKGNNRKQTGTEPNKSQTEEGLRRNRMGGEPNRAQPNRSRLEAVLEAKVTLLRDSTPGEREERRGREKGEGGRGTHEWSQRSR